MLLMRWLGMREVGDKIRVEMKQQNRAADVGRRRQPENIFDARRRIQNASSLWYIIVCELHRFFIAVARTFVNSDGKGCIGLDPFTCSAGCFSSSPENNHN